MVLCDLRELGEKGEHDSPKLRSGERVAGAVKSANLTARVARVVVSSLPVGLGAAVSSWEEECSVGGDCGNDLDWG